MTDPTPDVRPSPIAGRWYPDQAGKLAATVDQYMTDAPEPDFTGHVFGLIAPHAGYLYSGKIAGHAFRTIRGKCYTRVVVISPMHSYHDEPILTSGHQAYETPLGIIPVDQDVVNALRMRVPLATVHGDTEHALEIELPFLQRALAASFTLVPLMLRDQSYAMAERLGKALADIIKPDTHTLLVASSDLSHFYTDAQARHLDRNLLDEVRAFNPEGVIRADDEGRGFACGRAAIATVLVAARALGADRVNIVGYGTSADTGGNTQRVVGYGAAAIYSSS